MKMTLDIYNKNVLDHLLKLPEGEERDREALRALDIGITVIQRVSTSQDVEFVKHQVEELLMNVNHAVGQLVEDVTKETMEGVGNVLDPTKTDSHAAKTVTFLRDELGRFRKETTDTVKLLVEQAASVSTEKLKSIETLFQNADEQFDTEREDSYFGAVRQEFRGLQDTLQKMLDPGIEGSHAYRLRKLAEEVFSPDSPGMKTVLNAIDAVNKETQEELVKLREEIARKEGVAGVMEIASEKGFVFEDEVMASLESLASQFGDVVERTGGDVSKVDQSKRGDFLYVTEGRRMVVEAKDTPVQLRPMLKYMDDAMKNRDAEFGILVCKTQEQMQKQIGLFNLYESNKLFTTFEFLPYAMRYARVVLLTKAVVHDGVDANVLRVALETVKQQLKGIQTTKTKLTLMVKSATSSQEEIEKVLDLMKTGIIDALNRIEEEIE